MLGRAYSIDLNVPADGVGTPGPGDDIWRARKVPLQFLLWVTPDQGYIVSGGYCNFEFEKYRADDGKDYWRLTKWWDHTTGAGRGAEPASLGRVLALYH
jgi:hypothetical protein